MERNSMCNFHKTVFPKIDPYHPTNKRLGPEGFGDGFYQIFRNSTQALLKSKQVFCRRWQALPTPSRGFPRGPVARARHFHRHGPDSAPGQGTKLLQAMRCRPCPKIGKWHVHETNTTLQNNYTLIKINSKKLNIPTECSLVAQLVKDLPATQETWVGKIPWTRERLPAPAFWPV